MLVIPAKAGIQGQLSNRASSLEAGFRRHGGRWAVEYVGVFLPTGTWTAPARLVGCSSIFVDCNDDLAIPFDVVRDGPL
jgi:hypothetical protein